MARGGGALRPRSAARDIRLARTLCCCWVWRIADTNRERSCRHPGHARSDLGAFWAVGRVLGCGPDLQSGICVDLEAGPGADPAHVLCQKLPPAAPLRSL